MNDLDDDDDVFDEILLRRLSGVDLPEMALDAYRGWIADVTPPTDAPDRCFRGLRCQRPQLVQASAAESTRRAVQFLYRSLCRQGPRCSGLGGDVFVGAHGSNQSFHYSWKTTADYRESFGCLAFACGRGSALFQDAVLGDDPVLLDYNCLFPNSGFRKKRRSVHLWKYSKQAPAG